MQQQSYCHINNKFKLQKSKLSLFPLYENNQVLKTNLNSREFTNKTDSICINLNYVPKHVIYFALRYKQSIVSVVIILVPFNGQFYKI